MDSISTQEPGRRLLKWGLLGFAAMLLLAAVLLFTLDLGFLRGTIEDRVRQATGREFSINGPLSIRLGGELRVSAADIRFGNPAWAGEGPMARIAQLDARIDTRSLLSGPLTIHELQVSGLDLALQQDEEGHANWQFTDEATTGEDSAPVLLEQLGLGNSSIVLLSPRLDQPLRLDIAQLSQSQGDDGYLVSNLEAQLNGRPVLFEGRAGPYAELLAGGQVSIEGAGAFGRTELSGTALIDKLAAPERPSFELAVTGPELRELTDMLGIEGLGDGPLDLKLSASPDDGALALAAKGRLGALEVDVAATVRSLLDTTNAQINAQLSGPNFGRLARLAGIPGWPERPFSLDAQVHRPGTGLAIERLDMTVSDARLTLSGNIPSFPALAGAELALSAEGRDITPFEAALGLSDLPRGAFRISGNVQSGDDDSARLSLDYRFPVANGRISGTLGGGADLLGTDLEIEGQGNDALTFGNSLGLPGLPSAPWTVKLKLAISEAGSYRLGDLEFAAGGLDARLDGKLDAALPNERFELRFTISGPRLSALQGFVGDAAELPDLPFRATGRVNADHDLWRLDQVEGVAGETAFKISGALGLGEGYAGTDLAINASGKDLGQLASLPEPARLPDGPYELATRLKLAPGALDLQGFTLTAGALSVKADAALPWPLDTTGGRFNLQARGQDISRILPDWSGLAVKRNAFEADFKGSWTEQALALERATGSVGEARFSGEGTLALPSSPASTRLAFEANIPRPGQLLEASGKPWAGLPLALQASLEGTGKHLRAPALRVQLGANTVSGRLDLDFEAERPRFDMALQAGTLDLRPFQPEATSSAAGTPGTRVIPELAYPLDSLASASGSFAFTADQLLLRQGAFRDVRLGGAIRDGGLHVSELAMAGYKGRLTASLDLAPAGEQARLTTRVQMQDFVLDQEGLTPEQKAASPAFDTDVRLEGRGAGLRDTAAGLSGSVSLLSEGGRFYRNKKAGAKPQLLPAIIASIKPELARQDALVLACVAGSAKIANGRINLEPGFFAYTDKLKVHAVGNINLATEQLDLSVRTQERQADPAAPQSFAPALKVSGTLAAHEIGLDRKATLLSGSASFLKGGLSDLAKLALDPGVGSGSDPCTDILKRREPQSPP